MVGCSLLTACMIDRRSSRRLSADILAFAPLKEMSTRTYDTWWFDSHICRSMLYSERMRLIS